MKNEGEIERMRDDNRVRVGNKKDGWNFSFFFFGFGE